ARATERVNMAGACAQAEIGERDECGLGVGERSEVARRERLWPERPPAKPSLLQHFGQHVGCGFVQNVASADAQHWLSDLPARSKLRAVDRRKLLLCRL